MRVTILSKPPGGAVAGQWIGSLQVGQTYNLDARVARSLILAGYAIEERRWGERRRMRRPDSPGRRRSDIERD